MPANVTSPYWIDVQDEMRKIEKTISGSTFQSKECVYIVSKSKRGLDPDFNNNSGRITACSLKLAAQRLVEDTHEIASDEQIEKYLKAEEVKRREAALASKTTMVFQTPRPVEISK